MAEYRDGRFTSQDGLALHYRDYGDPLSPRLPVLCLTGLTRNSADFADLAARLATERRVLCPDYRGRGRSAYDRNWRNYDARVYLNDLGHLLAVTGIGRAVVIGTSLGGLLAMGLGALKPTALAGVVLNDIGPALAEQGMARILDYVGTDHPQPDWPSAVHFLRRLLPGVALRSEEEWLDFARATYRQGADGMLHFDWDVAIAKPLVANGGRTPDLWALFRGLRRVPTLAIRGGRSDVLTAETFDRMAEAKPDLRRVTVPEAGHTPTLKEPPAADALDDFLRQF
jgi:pimeloyl-ACP methyl ester carboxylesterase